MTATLPDRGAEPELLASHDILCVRAPNPGPLTLSGTNTWLVERGPTWVVDPGPADEAHVERVLAAIAARGGLGGIALTHDHHDALAQARRLRIAATGEAAHRGDAAAAFIEFFDTEAISHFREEEELLFPLLVEVSATVPDLLQRVLVEHIQIHCLVRRLRLDLKSSTVGAGIMLEVGERLEAHISQCR